MKHLFLDTATERALIGLAEDGALIESESLPVGLQNSRYLLPALIELLRKYGLTARSLGLISCGIGPGSYTGIRVGAALAQSMAFALKIPLGSFSSLEGFLPKSPGTFAAVLDARYGGIYAQKGHFDGRLYNFSSGPEVIGWDQAEHSLQGVSTLVGPKIDSLKAKLQEKLSFIKWEESAPSPDHLAHLSYLNYKRGNVSQRAELKLLYLRREV